MANPLYQALNKQQIPQINNMQNLINQFNQFKKTFSGNPQQQVQQLLNSGKMTQQQFNQLKQIADQLQGILK